MKEKKDKDAKEKEQATTDETAKSPEAEDVEETEDAENAENAEAADDSAKDDKPADDADTDDTEAPADDADAKDAEPEDGDAKESADAADVDAETADETAKEADTADGATETSETDSLQFQVAALTQELEKLKAANTELMGEMARTNAEAQRLQMAQIVSQETGVPVSLLHGQTRQEMSEQAAQLINFAKSYQGAHSVYSSITGEGSYTPATAADGFAFVLQQAGF